MKRFIYKAKTRDGLDKKGRVEARDIVSAVGVLREKGWVVVTIQPLGETSGISSVMKMFEKVKINDVVTFTRQLSTMIASGLPLTEALSVLEMQTSPAMARVIGEVLQDIQGGTSIAEALQKHDKVFSKVYISLVKAGEAAGVLESVLKRLATNMEKEKEFRAKTKGALIYPALVTGGMFLVAIVMMVFVIPKLTSMYDDFGAELPLPTRILMGVSGMFTSYWYIMLALAVGGVVGFRSWVKTELGRFAWDSLMLKMPVFGKLKTNTLLAETARTLGLLVGAGISILEALEIVAEAMTNVVYSQAIATTSEEVKKGIPFSIALTREGVFPPLLPNMVAVGEETGKMDSVLLKVSKYFEDEAEQTIKNLTTALEPLIMIVLGLGVGFLVVAIIMPIYGLTNQF